MGFEKNEYEEQKRKIQEQLDKLTPVDGNFFITSGEKYVDTYGEEQELEKYYNSKGKYCINNGVVAYVDKEGFVHAGFATNKNVEAIKNAGYEETSFGVPCSNGEIPADENANAKYTKDREEFTSPSNKEAHKYLYS